MRLWSLHPRYLDRQGLTACWREALLAQAVLAERTRGYRRHPQLERFRGQRDPLASIGSYLTGIVAEASARGYSFDATKIIRTAPARHRIEVTDGQLAREQQHLLSKLVARSPDRVPALNKEAPTPHQLFTVSPGPVADWERS